MDFILNSAKQKNFSRDKLIRKRVKRDFRLVLKLAGE